MRTTLELNDALVRQAKKAAAARGTTLTALIEESLRARLNERPVRPRRRRLPTFKGTGLRPGVDLADTSALLDLLDDADAAS